MRFTNIILGFEGKVRLNTCNCEGWSSGATKLGWAMANRATGGGSGKMGLWFGYAVCDRESGTGLASTG